MVFELSKIPESNFITLKKAAIEQFSRIDNPKKISLIAKSLGIRTFLQSIPMRELVISAINKMNEDELKEFLESNSEIMGKENEEEKGGE